MVSPLSSPLESTTFLPPPGEREITEITEKARGTMRASPPLSCFFFFFGFVLLLPSTIYARFGDHGLEFGGNLVRKFQHHNTATTTTTCWRSRLLSPYSINTASGESLLSGCRLPWFALLLPVSTRRPPQPDAPNPLASLLSFAVCFLSHTHLPPPFFFAAAVPSAYHAGHSFFFVSRSGNNQAQGDWNSGGPKRKRG